MVTCQIIMLTSSDKSAYNYVASRLIRSICWHKYLTRRRPPYNPYSSYHITYPTLRFAGYFLLILKQGLVTLLYFVAGCPSISNEFTSFCQDTALAVEKITSSSKADLLCPSIVHHMTSHMIVCHMTSRSFDHMTFHFQTFRNLEIKAKGKMPILLILSIFCLFDFIFRQTTPRKTSNAETAILYGSKCLIPISRGTYSLRIFSTFVQFLFFSF